MLLSSRSRNRGGRVLVAVLALSHAVSVTTACKPSAGSEGGDCKGGACHGYCDSGLSCDETNTCVRTAQPSAPSAPESASCWRTESQDCAGNGVEFGCSGGAVPDGPCVLLNDFGIGSASYCCTSAPSCRVDTPYCDAPAVTYSCADPATPGDGGAVGCVALFRSAGGHEHCCGPLGTCFAPQPYDSDLPCEAGAAPIYCAGDVTPRGDAGNCTEYPVATSGARARAFCCGAPSADAGAND